MKKLSQCCEICGDQATTGTHDMWCYEREGWLCYRACATTFRCEKHDRDSIIRTSDEEVFDILCRIGDSAIIVEDV